MSTAIQRRRGTTAQHSSFAGLAGELTVDTDKKTVVVHDGTTAGGMPLLPKTMSDGTANGVLYLNGSKVATSGSALTFDGTNLGVGVTPSAWDTYKALQVTNASLWGAVNNAYVSANVYFQNSGGRKYIANGYASEYSQASGVHAWSTAPSGTAGNAITFTQAMTLDASGNLGIGTSSPVGRLTLRGAAGTSGKNQGISLEYSNGTEYGALGLNNSSGWPQLMARANAGLTFHVNSDLVTTGEAMRLDSSGNLGIGTSSPASRLDVANSGTPVIFSMTLTGAQRWQQIIDTTVGNWTLKDQTAGVNALVVAAGSGNLGLGVTPSAWGTGGLGSSSKFFELSTAGKWFGAGSAATAMGSGVYYNSSNVATYATSTYALSYVQNSGTGAHVWNTAASGTAGNAITFTQAMTLDASGNLVVGATSAGARFQVTDASSAAATALMRFVGQNNYQMDVQSVTSSNSTVGSRYNFLVNSSNGEFSWSNSGGERARIDSSGNLLVGTTDTSGANTTGFEFFYGSGSSRLYVGHVTGTVTGTYYHAFNYAGTTIGSITQSGTTAVLFNVTSDQRLKENIVDAPEFGSVIDSIKVRSYDWKADGNHQRAGFVAQELVTVAPEAVHQPTDPEEMMAVDYSKLVPMLVKEIQSLRARVAQLESN